MSERSAAGTNVFWVYVRDGHAANPPPDQTSCTTRNGFQSKTGQTQAAGRTFVKLNVFGPTAMVL